MTGVVKYYASPDQIEPLKKASSNSVPSPKLYCHSSTIIDKAGA